MTQGQLARLSGVKPQTVSQLELAVVVDPRMSTLVAVAAALGVTIETLCKAIRATVAGIDGQRA